VTTAFGDPPAGFIYRPEFLSDAEEKALLEHVRDIDFSEIKMHGGLRSLVVPGTQFVVFSICGGHRSFKRKT